MPKGFLDLPTELRCVIYYKLLKSQCRHEFENNPDFKKGDSPHRIRLKWKCKANITPSLLFVNKLMHAEAMSVFLSINTLSFQTTNLLHSYLNSIHPFILNLRHIGYIDLGEEDVLKEILHLLKPAKHLIKLEITNEMTDSVGWFWRCTDKQLFRLLLPFLTALWEARKYDVEEKRRAAVDIVRIHLLSMYFRLLNTEVAKVEARAEVVVVEDKVKVLIRERFGGV